MKNQVLKFVGTTLLALAAHMAIAANNPLNTISADHFTRQSGGIKTEQCSLGGMDICSIHDGDYVMYAAYDFDSGVAGFTAKIAAPRSGTIEIRLDAPDGPVLGICTFEGTGGWQAWNDVTCSVDNSQAGVRDVYLVFHSHTERALLNVSSFVFQKSLSLNPVPASTNYAGRVDSIDDEVQSTNSWGMPENGFTDDFSDGHLVNWITHGLVPTKVVSGAYSATSIGTNLNFAITPTVYINKTDTGGEWRTLAEASLTADIVIDSPAARPGLGFSSKDGKQWVYVTLDAGNSSLSAWRKLADGSLTLIKQFSGSSNSVPLILECGQRYRLQIDWSPYSDGMIVFLQNAAGEMLANFRTVIDLPAARRPLLVCSGGNAHFTTVKFDPTLDNENLKWQWKKTPVLTPDVCNPAVWKGRDDRYYMLWRKFGHDTYHGIAASDDGISWKRISDKVLKCTGDMNVVVDPFGDGKVYVTPGGEDMSWYASDGADNFSDWADTGLKLGGIFGNSRIQEIIDTKRYKQMKPVRFEDVDYRFIAFTENWLTRPQPHTVVLLSNTLTNWVLADPHPLIPPASNFWGEKGNAIGSAIVLPDGNILVASCSCTFAGYTGAPEPSNISAVVDGKEPWKVLRLGVLPDAPVSREDVWYQGPNFGTALYYEPTSDTLFFYGGFHDYNVGMMRVQNFSTSRMFTGK